MDLQLGKYYFIPNDLADILETQSQYCIEDIKSRHAHLYDSEIDEYVEYICINRLGEVKNTPFIIEQHSSTYLTPHEITNAIVDIDGGSTHDYSEISNQLTSLSCQALELRFYFSPPVELVEEVLYCFEGSSIKAISIILSWSAVYTYERINLLASRNQRVSLIQMSGCLDDKVEDLTTGAILQYTRSVLGSAEDCGCKSSRYFVVNMEMYNESKSFNNCLNKKVSIDARGYIKNCPSFKNDFGHVSDTTLHDIVRRESFREVWNVKKDHVEICSDCEFRYMCTDCRVFTESVDAESEGLLSRGKPSKCSYDPYSASWE